MNMDNIQKLRVYYTESWMYPKQAIDYMFSVLATAEQQQSLKNLRKYYADCWMYPKQAIDEMCDTLSAGNGIIEQLRVNFVNCWTYPKDAIDTMIDIIGSALPRSATITDGVARITDGADDGDIIKLIASIEAVQSETISGWTQAKIMRTGKNLLPVTASTRVSNGITWTAYSDGTIIANGTATADSTQAVIIPSTVKRGNYYFCGCANGGSNSTYNMYPIDYTTGNRTKKWDGITNSANSLNETTPMEIKIVEGHDIRLHTRIMSGYTANNIVFKPMLIFGDVTDTTFTPYNGQTYTVSFPEEAGTVYGGELTVNDDGTGTLIKTMGYVDLESLTWTYTDRWEGSKPQGIKTNSAIIAEKYPEWTDLNHIGIRMNSSYNLWVVNGSDTESPSGNIVYELAEPVTYNLTELEVMKTLSGENNIWVDTGDILELEYYANLLN